MLRTSQDLIFGIKYWMLSGNFAFASRRRSTSDKFFTQKEQKFHKEKENYTKDYFEAYRNEIENDSVIRDFRRQIFQKKNQPINSAEIQTSLDDQQRKLETLLRSGSKTEANKYSKKVMQHYQNKRKMFKGYDNKEVFKDYADYTPYSSNYVKVQTRNQESMEHLEYPNNTTKTYEFVGRLPDDYQQKQEAMDQMRTMHPDTYQNMTLGDYGKKIQDRTQRMMRKNSHNSQYKKNLTGKQIQNLSDDYENSIYETTNDTLDIMTQQPMQQTGSLSTQVVNQIYNLYLQGWSIRQISKRFGILPIRTKLHIWCRARLFNQFVPKFGVKFLLLAIHREQEMGEILGTMDYGLDLGQLKNGIRYESITEWDKYRVDSQRKPQEYTKALRKLQQQKMFDSYHQIQVGQHGKQNKKHILKQWKFHRGKRSEDYILKNKTLNPLMWAKRNSNSVYY